MNFRASSISWAVIDRLCDVVIIAAICAIIALAVYYLGALVLPVLALCFLLAVDVEQRG
jgi:hypothetical protein